MDSGDPVESRRFVSSHIKTVNDSLIIVYADLVAMTGWWFETVSGTSDEDPVRFRLEYSKDLEITGRWEQVSRFEGAKYMLKTLCIARG
jgi:hypothetical protein